ncbi:MAG TPA: response regulator transcription factor [Verrucomicrobiota bacterium]|nr:response regulator transcription factor [Verrucomicrobiota bacterium]
MTSPISETQDTRLRVVVVDDHPMVRERLAEIINREPDLHVCGEAEDRAGALRVISRTDPALAIVDLTLKRSHGLELIKDLKVMHPELRILVVSMQEESLYAERVIHAGAHGYITKQEATRRIMEAIRKVLSGDIYLSEKLAVQIAARAFGHRRGSGAASVDSLADRELQVFELIGRGLGTRQIAEELNLDIKTIETYRARIKEKLRLKDASELLRTAITWAQGRIQS